MQVCKNISWAQGLVTASRSPCRSQGSSGFTPTLCRIQVQSTMRASAWWNKASQYLVLLQLVNTLVGQKAGVGAQGCRNQGTGMFPCPSNKKKTVLFANGHREPIMAPMRAKVSLTHPAKQAKRPQACVCGASLSSSIDWPTPNLIAHGTLP